MAGTTKVIRGSASGWNVIPAASRSAAWTRRLLMVERDRLRPAGAREGVRLAARLLTPWSPVDRGLGDRTAHVGIVFVLGCLRGLPPVLTLVPRRRLALAAASAAAGGGAVMVTTSTAEGSS